MRAQYPLLPHPDVPQLQTIFDAIRGELNAGFTEGNDQMMSTILPSIRSVECFTTGAVNKDWVYVLPFSATICRSS